MHVYHVSSLTMRSEEVINNVPGAICCCFKHIFWCWWLMSTNFRSHNSHHLWVLLTQVIHYNVLPGTLCCRNPRRACAARVTVVGLCVCVCVCVDAYSGTTRRPIRDTSGFRTTRAELKGQFSWNVCVRERQTDTVAYGVAWPNPSISGEHAYIRRDQRGMLVAGSLRPDPLALCTVRLSAL